MLTERNKKHLEKLLEKYNLNHLRPPPHIYEINIPQQSHFVDIGPDKKKRFIYYRVPYLPEQQHKIADVKMKMIDADIHEKFPQQIILKHLYAVQMNVEKCLQRLKELQKFQNNQVITTLNSKTIEQLQSGCIYTYGHDRNMKPIVILRADRFNYEAELEENYNAVYYLMLVVLGFRTVPYYAEKYVCIFDLCGMSFTQIPKKYMYEVMNGMNLHYCGNVQKTFIFNGKGIEPIWNLLKYVIPQQSRKKIIFVEQKNTEQILKQIDPLQLQKRYGGKLQNLKEYWPPKCTNEQFETLQLLKQKQRDDAMTNSEFYSVQNDMEYFTQTHQGICGSVSCSNNCRIF